MQCKTSFDEPRSERWGDSLRIFKRHDNFGIQFLWKGKLDQTQCLWLRTKFGQHFLIFLGLCFFMGRGYLPEVLRQIRSYLTEVLRHLRSYFPQVVLQIRSYFSPLHSSMVLCSPILSFIILYCIVQSLRIILLYYCIVLFGSVQLCNVLDGFCQTTSLRPKTRSDFTFTLDNNNKNNHNHNKPQLNFLKRNSTRG